MISSGGEVVQYAPQALGETVPMLSNGYFYPREGLQLTNRFATYAALYRAQPSIATVVDKIANSGARLHLRVWDVSRPGGRTMDNGSALARLLRAPCGRMSPYNFWRWVFSTYEVFGEAYILKQRNGAGAVINLLPMHPSRVIVKRDDEGNVVYVFSVGVASGGILEAPEEDVIPLLRYNPESLMRGMSRLEPLASTLANEDAARRANKSWWLRGARPSVVLSHPAELSQEAMDRVRQNFDARHAGADAMGGTAVLEEGMTLERVQLNAEEMQYIESRKLNMGEVCMVYDVPPPVVHILDHATFSNITEQMRSMYRDTMSPRLEDVESVLDHHLTAEFYGPGMREVEFDMTDVLRGDFESRASSAESLRNTGVATGNEAREIVGMTRSADPLMDKLFANAALVELGTPAQRVTINASESASPAQQQQIAATEEDQAPAAARTDDKPAALPQPPKPLALPARASRSYTTRSVMGRLARFKDATRAELRARLVEEHTAALQEFFAKQQAAAATAVSRKAARATLATFDLELGGLLEELGNATAKAVGDATARQLGARYDSSVLGARVAGNAKGAATRINATTAEQITKVLDGAQEAGLPPAEAVQGLFDGPMRSRAAQIATTRVAVISGIASLDAAGACGATDKTWQVESGNPRPEQEEMDGETVPLGTLFSNGMDGPGDYSAGVDEVAGCTCDLVFS